MGKIVVLAGGSQGVGAASGTPATFTRAAQGLPWT